MTFITAVLKSVAGVPRTACPRRKAYSRNTSRAWRQNQAKTARSGSFQSRAQFQPRAEIRGWSISLDPETPIKILIAERFEPSPRATAPIIAREPGFELVARAEDGESALRSARRHQPNVVILDLDTPRLNGIVATRLILRDCPGAQILFLTNDECDHPICDAVSAGVQGFLPKQAEAEEIVDAIRAVARGEIRLAPSIASRLFDEIRGARPTQGNGVGEMNGAGEKLTERENAILHLIVEGKGNREIAARLKLAEGTVKNYVSRILEKLDARSRTELVVRALTRPRP